MATPITAGAIAGEYMETLVIVEWRVAKGDTVAEGDVLLTIETAKAAVDVEAPCDGVISAIFAEAESEVPAAAVLCLIGKDLSDVSYDGDETQAADAGNPPALPAVQVASVAEMTQIVSAGSRIVASPAARLAAREAGVDLRTVRSSSASGRIKLRDITAASRALPVVTAISPATLPADESGPLKVHRSGTTSGAPVFLIHGFASDSLSWYPLDRHLAKSHPVYRLDLPNHGASPKRQVGTFANLVREVREAFDALDLDSVHVIGHSLGGALALALADTRPRKIASLALLAPGGLGPKINGDFIGGIARASRPESLESWLKVMVYDPRLIDPAFVNAAFAARKDAGLRAAQSHMGETLFADGTQGFDLSAALQRLECPARIVWGRKDRVLDWKDALRAPGHVGLHLLADVGHVPQLEAPDLTLDIVTALIKSV
ncbi:acetoin dehydrogenase dihydrolipoyllysine-residue acetyltransferase subunit [Sinorhizobium sp. RAC02]|uniref:acetoin dehydrogenase dihydrolipoyllysine-residue acetyltransferase subunit n=1 Tax=Sinorhizobium sp. RAC02 TaxID=1842534 RepID=UPI00083DA006|nr:acetoin dehydrogenase dihydrolipoyllysine-residue acetyltransferase subunit [Sinorhizobium sp. RAC02]AOF93381.1 e3 binding domain protein [Sinorhizobium sp. RAC02]